MTSNDTSLLRRALGANAAFSALNGLLLLVAAGTVGTVTGLGPVLLLRALGGGLVLFAVAVGLEARRGRPRPGATLLISGADLLWVAGSTVLLAAAGAALPAPGRWAVAAGAAVVLAFAALQLLGLGRAGGVPRRAS